MAKKTKLDGTKAKSNGGRPSKMTPEVLRKIEEVAALDGSIAEMAYYADVHVDTIYAYMAQNKGFSERIAKLREKPVLMARQRVIKGVNESYANAIDYLKRKKRLEFGDSIDHTTKGEALPLHTINVIPINTEGS